MDTPHDALTLFAPIASDGTGWVRIAEPQPDARAACMSVAVHVHLPQPGVPLCELEARAASAVADLEGGAVSMTVIDGLHRVDRIVRCADARGTAAPDVLPRPRPRARPSRPSPASPR